jgi:tetratricopeptide (TPR) repeat protein
MNKYIAFKATLALFLLNSLNWSLSAQENFAGVVERIRTAVVALIAYNDKGEVIGCGSGFFISSDGRLLSSRHLLRYASSAEVHTREGEVYPIRTVIAEDYKEAVNLSPDFAEAHYNLGASYLALGNNESAFETYGTLKNLNQKLASQLFDLLKKQYAVSVAAPPARSVHGFASPETPASQAAIQGLISRIRSLAEKRALPRGAADGLIAELQIANDQPDTGNAIIKINLSTRHASEACLDAGR